MKKKIETNKDRGRIVIKIPKNKIKFPGLKWPPKDFNEQVDLGDKLLEWLEQNINTKDLDPFPLSLGMNPWRFYRMDNEYFQECLAIARSYIGLTLKDRLDKVDPKSFCLKQLALYHPDWQQLDGTQQQTNIQLNLPLLDEVKLEKETP